MSVTSWFLVSSSGMRHRLPREMIFVGREDCELMLQSRSVDKQHAVINYNPATDEHLVKDLGSLNGTFVNDLRIPDQTYITLKLSDVVRFGYDSHVYVLERSQHKVPEEALKHEKYTSQLQMGLKASEGKRQEIMEDRSKLERSERKSLTEPPVPRPTPLYGQPSWWGEEDAGHKKQHGDGRRPEDSHPDIQVSMPGEGKVNGALSDYRDLQGKSLSFPYHREPSYFEIPTKEFQTSPTPPVLTPPAPSAHHHHHHGKPSAQELNEIPTKDTDAPPPPPPPTPTPPVVQSHASFTIEFDECAPGKIKIKDHVTKFSSRPRGKTHSGAKGLAHTPTEVMSAECKVADWLVHSDVSMMRRQPTCEDVYSTKSDLAMNIKTLRGHHHDDGTQSDSEDPVLKGKRSKSRQSVQSQESIPSHLSVPTSEPLPPQPPGQLSPPKLAPPSPVAPQDLVCLSPQEAPSPPQVRQPHADPPSQQAFVIEFFDDNPRKKRSQSFTANPDSYSALRAKLERRKGSGHSGERPASVHGHPPPTQQMTVPLKGSAHGHPHPPGPQRSSSLKREKTEETSSGGGHGGGGSHSPSPPGPAASRPALRQFGSAGRKSRLAQEFAAELLKESPPPPPMSAPPVLTAAPSQTFLPSPGDLSGPGSVSYPSSPSQCTTTYPTRPPAAPQSPLPTSPSPPVPQEVPVPTSSLPAEPSQMPPSISMTESFSMSTSVSISISGVDPRTSRAMRTEEEDSLSDAGTYTIETESQDKEVEEARSMIDQVFGVLDSPEYSGPTLCVTRPVIEDGREEHPVTHSPADLASATIQGLNIPKHSPDPAQTQLQASQSSPKWMSRWASLADSYTEPGAPGGSPQMEPDRDGRMPHSTMLSQSLDVSETECSQGSRTRRLLPQVPLGDKSESPVPCVLIRHDPYLDCELPERGSGTPTQQDSAQRLCVQDDVDPDSLSDTSRSEDGSILERKNRGRGVAGTLSSPGDSAPWGIVQEPPAQTPKSTSFYIGSDDGSQGRPEASRSPLSSQSERDPSPRTPPTTVLIRHLSGHEPRRSVKPNSSAPNLQTHDRDSVPTKDPASASGAFVRQESFTKERTSDDVQVKRLPHISSHPTLRDLERAEAGHEPPAFLQEAERAFSSPEDKHSSRDGKTGEDSMSGESDVDTASTVSMVSSKNAPVTAPKKRLGSSGTQKERSGQDKGRQPTARERLSEKRRSHTTTTSDSAAKAGAAQRLQLRRSAGNRGSLDLSEGQQNHGQNHWADAASSSDHESGSRAAARKRLSAPPLKEEAPSKTPSKVTPQVLTRSNSLSAPRPTRASMLRRARLGETSDNEGTETDRASQSSDHGKTPADSKKLSRLDILAMPRKRTGSFTAPSDTESTSGRTAPSTRTSEPAGGSRKAAPGEPKQGTTKTASATAKLPSARTRSSTAKHTNAAGAKPHKHQQGARWRQKGSDYSSTSEEEQEVSSGSQKHKRSHASASTQTTQALKVTPVRSKSISLEPEEEEQNEHFQNWSTHSAEIARLSQDLAKDLAILAREIHDVAGDGDSQSSGMGTTTSPSSMPNTPASNISAREERPYASLQGVLSSQLVQHIPEASLNYQKVPPGSLSPLEQDSNMNEQESKRRPWNREEVILDNLMLNPVSQLSQAIRENTEQLTEKMKVMFRNKTEVWEEIEAKINAENEVPILKTSNKEISSILQELRRVQRQLEVINTIVEPSGSPKMAATASPAAVTPRHTSKAKTPSQARPSGGRFTGPTTPNANERTKRGTRGSDDQKYLV
ncbi:centrosomal protein of 170 kDa protein B isoform X2 [Alosa alosa]|uniref:centrosomal protein of 170 kDa protein B isoform X2 n=1 Tax=Alosa alosa TaxID=278164 RepID=UPI0020154628|nr:centrosomal protein of 170 kDa protein B isoform X2 [Alosa alosa]